MKIQIKNRYTNGIIIEGEAENIKEFLEKNKEVDLSGANLLEVDLSRVDLSGVDLSGSDLSGVDLSGADLYKTKIKITQKDEIIKALKIEIIE